MRYSGMKKSRSLCMLITRPAHQATELSKKIAQQGGIPILFPTIVIKTLNPGKKIEIIKTADFIIFLSPNGVMTALPFCKKLLLQERSHFKILAVGPSTASVLTENNLSVDAQPMTDFNSEGLLALPELQALQQKNIILFQGEKGRSHLAEVLMQRGAKVEVIPTYRRVCPNSSDVNVPAIEHIDLILCTSTTGIANLVTLLYPYWKSALFKQQLVVISPRIARFAEEMGFVKKSLIADNASDESILRCLFSYTEKSPWNLSPRKN